MFYYNQLEGSADWATNMGPYNDLAHALLVVTEGFLPEPYVDTAGIPTIGIGFNLRVLNVRNEVLTQMGLDSGQTNDEEFIQRIITIVEDQRWGTTGWDTAELQRQLNEVMHDAGAVPTVGGVPIEGAIPAANRQIFEINAVESRSAFNLLAPTYEGFVNDWIRTNDPTGDVPFSRERAVFLSLAWNGFLNGGENSPSLRAAIRNDDRAEAWYEIRYNTTQNPFTVEPLDGGNGFSKRHYTESHIFGLYDDIGPQPGDIDEQDALNVFRMFNKHENMIRAYDARWGHMISTYIDPGSGEPNNAEIDVLNINTATGVDYGTAAGRNQSFAPAKEHLAAIHLSFDEGTVNVTGTTVTTTDLGAALWGAGNQSLRHDLGQVQQALLAQGMDSVNVNILLGLQANLTGVFVAATAKGATPKGGTVEKTDKHQVLRFDVDANFHDLIFGDDSEPTVLDELDGGGGSDFLVSSKGPDYFRGGGNAGTSIYGSESDTVSYAAANAATGLGVTVVLPADGVKGGTATGGDAVGDIFKNIENVIGTAFADTFTGNDRNNILVGLAGIDTFLPSGGNSTLR